MIYRLSSSASKRQTAGCLFEPCASLRMIALSGGYRAEQNTSLPPMERRWLKSCVISLNGKLPAVEVCLVPFRAMKRTAESEHHKCAEIAKSGSDLQELACSHWLGRWMAVAWFIV